MISQLSNSDVIEFIQENLNRDPASVALQADKFPNLPMREIASQIASRQKVAKKLPEWVKNERIIFPLKENLEQASSQITAEFKSDLVEGEALLDLTGGSGIDTYYLQKKFNKTVYVEPNFQLCEIAHHNFTELNADIEIIQSSAEDYILTSDRKYDLVYIDPSRRSEAKQKVIKMEDYSPNVFTILPKLCMITDRILIKVSPMMDIKQALNELWKVEKIICLSVANEMKEVLIEINLKTNKTVTLQTVNINHGIKQEFSATFEEERLAQYEVKAPQKYIYEPNTAIRKAGLFKLISERFQISKLQSNTHLYTSNYCLSDFPGKCFECIEIIKTDKKSIRKAAPKGIINVITKNYPLGANAIKKKYQLKDGGEKYLIFCNTQDLGNVCLHCSLIK